VDGELSPSERVILEQHFGECAECTQLLRDQQKCTAQLFELFQSYQLTHSLRTDVMRHLPEMDHNAVEMEKVNLRAKNPVTTWSRVARVVPAVAVVFLLCLAIVIQMNWPQAYQGDGAFGVVSYVNGAVNLYTPSSLEAKRASTRELIKPGMSFETGPKSRLMLALASGTQMKVNDTSRVKVFDERHVRLEKGEIWLDVGREKRLFKVDTQDGVITVFGTAFNVALKPDRTIVTVERGEVQVENKEGFRLVRRGQQVSISLRDGPVLTPRPDLKSVTAWASALVPDQEAMAEYAKRFPANTAPQQVQGVPVFFLSGVPGGDYQSIIVTWDKNQRPRDYCDYTVYVFTETGQSVLTRRISGDVFNKPSTSRYEIPVQNAVGKHARAWNVRLVPDFETGNAEPTGLNVLGTYSRKDKP